MDKFKWLYVGCGNIAATTANAIEKGNHCITGVYSRTFSKAQNFAKKHNATAYESYNDALELCDCDGVYIATVHTAHVEYAMAAMEKGKAVLCEKPVGINLEEVEMLTTCAKKNNVYFAEAMWTWFGTVAPKVKEWISQGKTGNISEVVIHYSFPGVLMPKTSRVLTPETAGGALLDIGIYPITYCYNLFGYPDRILCDGKLKNGIDIKETVTLWYGNMKCTLNMSLTALREGCVIKGDKGVIKVAMFHMASKAVMKGESKEVFHGKTDYLTEFNIVSQEIRQGKKQSDFIPFSATENCMKIMDVCRKQMNLKYPCEK